MKILGTVLHTSSHKNLIVRGDEKTKRKLPKINSVVFNQKKKQIGKINDIFGPVGHPYFSVRIFRDISPENLRDFKHRHVYVQ